MSDTDKITDLETRLAQQEHTLDELSDVVAEQSRVIDLLREQLRRMTDRVAQVEDSAPDKGPDEPPPPHY